MDSWHRIQMARNIDKETDNKKLNDTILQFAKPTQKVTETKFLGQTLSLVKADFNKGT